MTDEAKARKFEEAYGDVMVDEQDGYLPDCGPGNHCFCESSGDVDYVGEPYYMFGIVFQCCRCGEGEIIPSQDITDEIYQEEWEKEMKGQYGRWWRLVVALQDWLHVLRHPLYGDEGR